MDRQDRLGGTRVTFSGVAGSAGVQHDRMPHPPIDGVAPRWAAPWHAATISRQWQPFQWVTCEAVGWPARAMSSSFESQVLPDLTMEVKITRGIRISDLPKGMDVATPFTLRLLPTQILWSGFALNWLVYVLVLFGVLAFPGAAKRGMRRRRGRCIACGYDLRHKFAAGCPECGWGRVVPSR
jgi:hypothetical protein